MTGPLPSGLAGWRKASRVRRRNDRPVPTHRLRWLQQALREPDNPVIDAAVRLGNPLDVPVLVYSGVREDYPYASDRLHHVILGTSRDLACGCRDGGLTCGPHVNRAGHRERAWSIGWRAMPRCQPE